MIGNDIDKAKKILEESSVVGMPTETVYGLAARIDRENGLKKIFSTKERPFFDPLIVHISSLNQLDSLTKQWTDLHQLLADHFWPGPLTMILPKSAEVNPLITSGLTSVGIRFPAHPIARQLIEVSACPLAAPSANKFGKTSPTLASHVEEEFHGEVYVLEGGPCQIGIESTVLEIIEHGKKREIKIYRPGMVQASDLRILLQQNGLNDISVYYAQSEVAPGHLKHHYMPQIPLIMSKDKERLIEKYQHQKTSWLQLSPDPALAARELYEKLRQCGTSGSDVILFELKNEFAQDEWAGPMNRLTKAATTIMD